MMGVLVILVVSCHMWVINGLDITVCKNGGNFPSVNLNCSTNDTIHVERIGYFYNGSSDCSSSTVPCGQPLTNTVTGLISSCTGQPLPCQQYIPNYSNCTGSTVNYRCIPRENGQDMCQSQLNLTETTGQLFLVSPNYPTTTTGFKPSEPSCGCDIRGTSITSITILDLVLKTGRNGTRSNLFIQYGDITYNTTSRENPKSCLKVYNHRLLLVLATASANITTADIILTHQQINGLKLWIEIQGVALAGSCNNISGTNVTSTSTSTTPFTSPPQPDSTTTPGTSPSSTSTATHTSTDPSTSSEPSSVHSTTVNNTDSSTTTDPSTSFDRSTDTSERSQPATNPSDSAAQQTDKGNILLIVGCVVGGLILILVAVCVLVGIRRKRANILQQNVHVHINNTTNNTVNNTTPNYFVLEGLNTQDVEVKHDDNSTNPASVATGRTPKYAVVNKTGRGFNVTDVNKPDQATKSNETGVSDMEILENDMYIPYEATNNQDDTGVVASITNNTKQHRPFGDMELLDNELYVPYEASNNQDDTRAVASTTNNVLQHEPSRGNPDNTGMVASTTNNTTQHRPSGDMEIMENDLYVPFEDSVVEVSKPTTNSVYDNAAECGTQQDVAAPEMKIETKQDVATPEMEILENDLYVPFEDTDNAHNAANKPSDQAPVMEILENDLYVPFEKTQE